MRPRAPHVVAALAAVAVVLAVVAERRSAPPTRPGGERVLPGLAAELESLRRVTLVTAGGTATATLERTAGTWTVAERDAYPADLAKLRTALLALAEARVVEPKTADPRRHARLGVEDVALETASGTLVRLAGDDGTRRELILGVSDRAGERYARRPGEAQSWLIDRNPELPEDPARWLAPRIVDVAGTRVQSVSIRHADGETLELTKAEPGQRDFAVAGRPAGRELDGTGAANAAGGVLTDLRLVDAARFEPGSAGEPVAAAAYTTFDGLVVEVDAYTLDAVHWLTFDAAAADSAGDDVRAEAAAIDARVAGWRYRIAPQRYERLTRRVDELLAPAE